MTVERVRDFRMPDVGEGLSEAEILTWFVRPGDRVHDGMIVCEVETAKAVVELPIPYDGLVRDIRSAAGETVDVGAVIISVDTASEEPAELPEPSEPDVRPAMLVGYGVMSAPGRRRPRRPSPAARTPAVAAGEKRPAKPPVRKLARDLGVNLDGLVPTGADGLITREDVLAASRPEQPGEVPGERRIPVKGIRRATARAMVASAFTAPHVTEFVDVDVTATVRLIQRLKADPEFAGRRVTPLLLIAKALLTAIRKYPEINASWVEQTQEIVVRDAVNLGVAVATPRGLLVPNVKGAQALTLPRLADSLQQLTETAREGRTPPADLGGGTVTITNIGVFGVDSGTPILNPGEAAILAVGSIKDRPWIHHGRVRPRRVATLALSFDHRLVDGELGSRVLAMTAAILEQPKRLIVWS